MMNLTKETESLLLPPQINHVKTLLASLLINGHAEDLSEMGTGKSYMGAAVMKESNMPFLLICPKAVMVQWERIFKAYNVKPIGIINYEKIARGNSKFYKYVKVKKIGVIRTKKGKKLEMFEEKGEFRNLPSNAVIMFDEVHKCKSLVSKNSELLYNATIQGFKRYKMSGSMGLGPQDFYSIGLSAGLHTHGNTNEFKRQFCIEYGCEFSGRFFAMTFDPSTDKGRQGMLKIHNRMFNVNKSASRLTVKDMGSFFPETKIMPLALDMGANSNKIQRVYNQMQREIDLLEKYTEDYSQHVFAIIMKARRSSELLKVPTFVEEIETAYTEGRSIAAFFNFTETIQAVTSRLEKNKDMVGKICFIVGGQHPTVRQQAIDDFQNDTKHIILCNIKAGGTGISLHDLIGTRPRTSLVSPGFSAIELIQSLSRVHRQGGKTKSLQRVIFAGGTIEEDACNRLQYRIDNLAALNDGDLLSGVQFYGNNVEFNFENN